MYETSLLPNRLRMARKYRSLDQIDIAKVFGITVAGYGKWELGHRSPNADQLAVIADMLHLDINFFFLREMSLQEADINVRKIEKPIEKMAQKLEELEKKLLPNLSDPLLEKVQKNRLLHDLVEMAQHWDEEMLKRLIYSANSSFTGTQKESQDGRDNERTVSK